MSVNYTNIGIIMLIQNKISISEEYILKGKNLAIEIGHKEFISYAYEKMCLLDSARGNYKGAFENHKMYILYNDSIINEETRNKTMQSQMTYDFDKKEAVATAEHKKELENQELLSDEKSRKQKTILIFVIIGLLLVIIFASFVFRSLRLTRKQKTIIEQQKDLVEIQKKEVELQKQIVDEHQKSIIDSITYARRIQQSLLPTEKYIEKNLNRLKK